MAGFSKGPIKVTPKGTAIFPRLNTPDTKYKAEGVYEVKLAFDADTDLTKLEAAVQKEIDKKYDAMVAELKEAGKAGLAKKITKRPLDDHFKAEEDEATGDETGRIVIKAKMNASGTTKAGKQWSRKPTIVDAKGNVLKKVPPIGGGTIMKLSVELFAYYAPNDKVIGCSFRLEGVQIITLTSYGERNAESLGFGEEDGDDLSDFEGGEDDTPPFDADGDEDDEL